MSNNKQAIFRHKSINQQILFAVVLWTLLVGISQTWNKTQLEKQAEYLATEEARANWDKDQAFRRWATRHGGVYVKPNTRTPPNPYLAHLPKRDIVTTDGTRLTLMNPAYMMRQLTDEFEEMYGVKGSITGQILLNPINKADPWELQALKRFDKGEKEIIDISALEGQPYLRLMKPMVMEQGCVKCHGHLGFKEGDIRGGVSVSIPLAPYLSVAEESIIITDVTHGVVWILGLIGIAYAAIRKQRYETERTKHEQDLRRSQKMDAIGQLSGGIAHDFNNQLGIILGYLDLIKDETTDNKTLNKYVDSTTKAALRCTDLTRQLLSFSHTQSDEMKIVDINLALKELQTMVARSVTPAITIQYNLAENIWLTEVNEGDFQDAIINLIINARDSMPNGGTLSIKTNNIFLDEANIALNMNAKAGHYVQITLSDTGHGMSSEILERVFEPFYTTKPKGKGTGLGMSMVFGFVQRSLGFIHIDSEVNKGTSIHLYLPRTQKLAADTSNKLEKNVLPKGTESILIVDDEPDLLALANQYLTELGYRTYQAKNANEAIQMLKKRNIDCLFSDVIMPGGMDGYELAQQVNKQYPQLKILLVSGYTPRTIKRDKDNDFSFLKKPYRKGDLAKQIRLILDE